MSEENETPKAESPLAGSAKPPTRGGLELEAWKANQARKADAEALERLVQNDRVRQEAGMPNKITAEKLAESLTSLRAYMDRFQIPLAVVGKQASISVTTLSELFGGKYAGDREKMVRALVAWRERDSQRRQAERPKDYVETSVAGRIRAVVRLADKHTSIAVIVAPSGTGKTYTLKALAAEMNGVFVVVNHTHTPREFLNQIAIQLGRKPSVRGTNKADLHRYVVAALRGTNRPLFIDEAHQLGKSLSCVRAIFDEAATAVILAGTASILEAVNDRADGAGQFGSRTIHFNAMEAAGTSEPCGDGQAGGKRLFTVEEIQRFFASREMRLDRDAIGLAWQLANLPGFGSLRLIERAALVVFDIAPGTEVVTRAALVSALRLLHAGDFGRMEGMAAKIRETPDRVARTA